MQSKIYFVFLSLIKYVFKLYWSLELQKCQVGIIAIGKMNNIRDVCISRLIVKINLNISWLWLLQVCYTKPLFIVIPHPN